MSQTRLLERLSAQDHHSVLGDDFGWPWDIGVLATVDGARLLDGDGRVRIDEVRRQVEPRLHLLPRFRQILHRPPRGLGWPLWVDAQSFDLADHIRVFPLPASAGETQLLEACEELRRRRLDPTRPLWEMWLLPGLAQRRVGLYLRMHHAIADGVAGLRPSGRCSTLPPMRPCRRRRRGHTGADALGGGTPGRQHAVACAGTP